ncbi:MAG: choice-of-anchor H family protein, partial [Pseudomonadota bacterium]
SPMRFSPIPVLMSLILLTAGSAKAAASTTPSEAKTGTTQQSNQGYVRDRVGRDDSKAKTATGTKPTAGDGSARKSASLAPESVNVDFWIYDARTVIRDDFDGDGFFTRVELTFDADTIFTSADVFAVLYLSLEGGTWEEYGETDVFDIFGTSGNDEYFFDTDLLSGFPPGSYDILIELYDAFDNSLAAVYGPEDDLDLFDLPLESVGNDGPAAPIVVSNTEGGGGALGLLGLTGLALLVFGRRISRY